MNWFADVVGTTRIDIPAIGGWIEVRNEISIGEERKAFSGAIRGTTPTDDGKMRTEYDADKLSFGMVLAYVTDWSARDEQDKPKKFTADAVRALRPDIYKAIDEAVDKHVKAIREAREGNATRQNESGAALTSVSAA